MKKLITMMAALATGFFAFGDDPATPSNAQATFEGYEAGTLISSTTREEGAEGGDLYWLLEEGADEESGTVTAYADGAAKPAGGDAQYLAVETGAQPIYRSITDHGSDVKTLGALTAVDISDTGIFLDTQVKFTPSAEAPTYTEGTKLIVWAQEIEADPDNEIEAATNLVVTAGSYADPMAQAVFKLVVPENFDFTAWHRLTIRAIKDVTNGSKISGFTIFIDGKDGATAVAAADADYATKIVIAESALTSVAKKFYVNKQLFLSCAVANTDNQALRAFGVQGSGAVDNLAAYDKVAAKDNCPFALGENHFTVKYKKGQVTIAATFVGGGALPQGALVEDEDGDNVTAAITVDGSYEQIVVTATPAAGFMITDDKKKPTEDVGPWTLDVDGVQQIYSAEIAFTVGGNPYATFGDALAAAQGGKTLVLAQNFSVDMDEAYPKGIEISANTTIDLNGQTILVTGAGDPGYEANGFNVLAGATLTVIDSGNGGTIAEDGSFDAAVVGTADGATFVLGANSGDNGAKIDGWLDNTNGGTIKLVNGYVNKTINTDVTDWLDEGKEATDNGDGFWKIAPIQATPFAIIIADKPVYFPTLEAAIEAAGTTVDEVTYPATVTLMASAELATWVAVKKEVTLDLNGYTLSAADGFAKDGLLTVWHGGFLTINDSSNAETGAIDASGVMAAIKMTQDGTDVDDSKLAKLVVNGGTITGYNYGIAGNGNAGRGNTYVEINGGKITAVGVDKQGAADSCAIFNPQPGDLVINDGEIEAGMGIIIKSGKLTVNGGSIKATGEAATWVKSNNGFNNTGDAIEVDNIGYPGESPVVEIKGGDIESENGAAVASQCAGAYEQITGFVTGGTFTGNAPIDAALAGGTFAFGPFVPGEKQTLVDAVAKIGDVNYASLAAAIAAAGATDTVTLLDDIELAERLIVSKKLTLDLAGFEVTCAQTYNSGIVAVARGGDLTINDSSDPSTGKITGGSSYAAVALTYSKATCTADEYTEANKVKLTVNGGMLTGYYYGITGNGSAGRGNTELVVNGGTIWGTNETGDKEDWGLGIYNPQEASKVTIAGGTIKGKAAAIEIRSGELAITGGTLIATADVFDCTPNGDGTTSVGAAVAVAQHTTKQNIVVDITGGTLTGVKAVAVSNPQLNPPAETVAVTLGNATYNGALYYSASDIATVTNNGATLAAPEGYVWDNDGKLVAMALPEATATEIDVASLGLATGVTFTAENQGAGYNDWQAKFVLKSDIAIGEDEIALYGQYGDYPWTAIEFPGCEAGEEIDVLGLVTDDPDYANITVNDVFTLIQQFNCAISNIALKADASFDLSLIITDGKVTNELCAVTGLSVEQSEPTGGNFQIVDGKSYATLAEAVEAAEAGDTIELLDDDSNAEAVTIDKAITLDLGGFTLTSSAAITIAANVTVDNGTIEMLAGNVMAITSGKTILADDATIKTHGTYQLTLGAATFDIYGTIIGDDQGVDEGGQAAVLCESAVGVINVYDGANVEGADDAFRLKYGATLNIYGGRVSSKHNWPIVYAYKTGTPSTVNVYGGIFDVNVGATGSEQYKIGAFRIKDDAVVTPLDDTCTAKFSKNYDDKEGTKKWADFLKPGYALKQITGGDFDGYYQIAAQYALTFTAEGADDVVVKFFEGDTVQAPAAPTAPAGKKFDGWKDSAGTLVDAGADITPAAANATYTAQFSDAGIGPGEVKPVEGDDEETARENAQKLPIVLTEEQVKAGMTTDYLINNVKSNGAGGFVAFVDVDKAAIEAATGMPIGLDTTAEEPLKVDAENVTAKVRTVAGVWYGMDEAGELTGAEFDPVVSTYVIGDGTTKTFTIPKKANATKAFYKVGVRVVPPAAK